MTQPPLRPKAQPNQAFVGRQRRRFRGALVAALLSAAVATPSAPAAEVLDRVVAVVEGQVISQSELEFEARVALVQRGGLEAAEAPLDDATLKAALELSIAHRLQVREAERLQAFLVDEGELERALGAFKARFASDGELDRFLARQEADLATLVGVLARRVRAEKILDSKIRLKAQVSEVEVRRYHEEHGARLGMDYEAARASIREVLLREKYGRLARAELSQLRRSADVRLVAPFARGEAR